MSRAEAPATGSIPFTWQAAQLQSIVKTRVIAPGVGLIFVFIVCTISVSYLNQSGIH